MMKKKLRSALSFLLSLTILVGFLPFTPMLRANAEGTGTDWTKNTEDLTRSLKLSYQLQGQSNFTDLTDPYQIPDSSKLKTLHAEYSFSLKDGTDESGGATRSIQGGDYYFIGLPAELNTSLSPGDITETIDNVTYTIAHYEVIDGKIKVTFANTINNSNLFDIHGDINLDFTLDMSSVTGGTTKDFTFPIDSSNNIIIHVTKPVPPATTPSGLTKSVQSYDNATRTLVWKVDIAPANGTFEDCTFTDTIDTTTQKLLSVKHGSDELTIGTDYTYDASTGLITYTIPKGRNGTAYQSIYITTEVKGEVYTKTTETDIKNTAHLTGGAQTVNLTSNDATQKIQPNWLEKKGTGYDGNSINWEITANTTQQPMYDAVVTDNFTSDVELNTDSVKVNNTSITVYTADSDHTPANATEIYGILTKNEDGTSKLEIYFPRGEDNASTAVQNITLSTKIVKPADGVATSKTYNNTATMSGKFKTGDGDEIGNIPDPNIGTIGYSVPAVAVFKTHDDLSAADKSNGTITWYITAVSNHSAYGKSTIVDTLPDDQDYVANEIYWYNPDTNGYTKIDKDSTPKAEISGQTLTVTFSGDSALQTQQEIKLQTKIKDYGKNLSNQTFQNKATATIYEKDFPTQEITHADDTDSVQVTNTVIAKSSQASTTTISNSENKPRVDYSITINANKMPLTNATVEDDLNNIVTKFQKSGSSTWDPISGLHWTYVADSLSITKDGTKDTSFNAATLKTTAQDTYDAQTNNKLTINLGNINDTYTIKFTAELDVTANDTFKTNGTISNSNNTAEITAGGLTGNITSTGNETTLENTVLGKSGVQKGGQIIWNIRLNQHQIALTNRTVKDVLPLGLTLDPTSVKLYKNVIQPNGNFYSDVQMPGGGTVPSGVTEVSLPSPYTYGLSTVQGEEGRYVLTVSLPDDNVPYILQFATDIDESVITNGNSISNSASYSGQQTEENNSTSPTIKVASTSSGGLTIKSSLAVQKQDEKGNSLNGAVFALYWQKSDAESVFVRNLTAQNGQVIFRGLTIGAAYRIIEITPPKDYNLDSTPYEFTATATNTPHVFIDTKKTTDLSFTKTDGTNPLPGAEFTLTGNGVNQTVTSDKDGKVTFTNVPYGDGYTITETKAPDGYKISSTPIPNISIHDNTDGTAPVITGLPGSYPNAPLGSITVTKVGKERSNAETAVSLSGVSFTLSGDQIEAQTKQTGGTGVVSFTDLPMGTYTLHEDAPDGYQPVADQTVTLTNETSDKRFYTETVENVKKLGSIAFLKADSETGKPVAGAEFTLYYDAEKTQPVHNADGTVATAVSGADGTVTFANIPYGDYYIAETKAPLDYQIQSDSIPVGLNAETVSLENPVENTRYRGTIQFSKMGSDGRFLAGAQFALFDSDGNQVGENVTSDLTGLVKFENVRYGDYIIREIGAPFGYLKHTADIPAGLHGAEDHLVLTLSAVTNQQMLGTVQVKKTDIAGNPLAGAQFTLYDSDGKEVATSAATGADGIAVFQKIPVGVYTIRETKAPEGYLLSDEVLKGNVTEENYTDVQQLAMVNHKAGTITVTKVDADAPGQTLAGAQFQLFDQNGNAVGSPVETGADGTAVFKDLAYGTYTVKELKAPAGYLLGSIPLTASVSEESTAFAAAVPNKKILGTVQVVKTNRTGKPLSGAEFTLSGADGTVIGTAVTGADGTALFQGLPAGNYTVKETKAPKNFQLNKDSFPVAITAENYETVQTVTVKDISLEGFDDDGNPLAGPETPTDNGENSPQTGEGRSPVLPIALGSAFLAAASCAALLLLRGKKPRAKHFR